MPLVAHSKLPTFERLKQEGQKILPSGFARQQDIRELHIGLLNMMPDAALAATERQFFRLIGESNPIAQFYMHPFTLPVFKRSEKAQAYIDEFYESFEDLKQQGLDALIITGANVTQPNLSDEVFWEPLTEIIAWAEKNVTSTLCSCLATHAVLEFRHKQKRRHMDDKCWGVFSHHVRNKHPLVNNINTRFDVPHSRFNQIAKDQFQAAGLRILVESEEAGVHMAVSSNGISIVYFQGHPEYDTISLLKEYKREVLLFAHDQREQYPPFPAHFFDLRTQAVFNEYKDRLVAAKKAGEALPEFPEALAQERLHNTWRDTGAAVIGNWMGLIYQLTNTDRRLPFMDGIDPQDPLKLKST
jgi:homoserine O-succinyltransferase